MSDREQSGAPPSVGDMPDWQSGTRLPRVSVRALVLDGDDIVAVENLSAPGKLHMPGGGIEHGETMLDALKRELREELCVGPATADYLLAIENLFDTYLGLYHCVEHVFVVTPDGRPRAGEDGLKMHRLPFAEIGRANLYPTAFRDVLARTDWREQRCLRAGKFADDH
ncbi:NUDIX domain-containing protein [Dichotomicrobium thermohalophilum]|uniref:ADP-ribose pyrophosphatase YjhB (NUDIX family) n=1 Tax=Dichotomicrobium thermohalophilum TaxID=933063 RepID=A0A397Q379_9HYPH|nr:NUDIX domain-containing protein [Dichotomicrobium thermohalophilum]RIA55498.1 ADP-ribose pyrophosphatase YjhB (NUDIX family) [Dichotomicrobium thermohalophilum]